MTTCVCISVRVVSWNDNLYSMHSEYEYVLVIITHIHSYMT